MSTIEKQAGQVYFERGDYRAIKMLAAQLHKSFAEFVREAALKEFHRLEQQKNKKGRVSDIEPVALGKKRSVKYSESVDEVLYE
jgi:predicted DNA-binding WGR domain protein